MPTIVASCLKMEHMTDYSAAIICHNVWQENANLPCQGVVMTNSGMVDISLGSMKAYHWVL